jgi:GNAT superfamily N-acetyltransferase
MADFQIKALEDVPDLAAVVARWVEDEWHRLPIHDYFDDVATGRKKRDGLLPRTFVAVREGEALGTVSLLLDDMETRPDLNPWLACLYVQTKFRKQGIGAKLVRHAERIARSLGIRTLILFTVREAELFSQLGWKEFGREFYEGESSVLMKKSF